MQCFLDAVLAVLSTLIRVPGQVASTTKTNVSKLALVPDRAPVAHGSSLLRRE